MGSHLYCILMLVIMVVLGKPNIFWGGTWCKKFENHCPSVYVKNKVDFGFTVNIYFFFFLRTMVWRQITWRTCCWRWELWPTAFTTQHQNEGRALRMKATRLGSSQMNSSPLWLNLLEQPKASWHGWTGTNIPIPHFFTHFYCFFLYL